MIQPIAFEVTANGALKWGVDEGLSAGYLMKKDVADGTVAQVKAAIYYPSGTVAIKLMDTRDSAFPNHTIAGTPYTTFQSFEDKLLELGFRP